MTTEEYLNQTTHYFSESEQRLVPLEEMVSPHLLNAYSKLARDLKGQFIVSPLARRMASILQPNTATLRSKIEEAGAASVYVGFIPVATARSRLYRAGAKRTYRKGGFVVGDKGEVDVIVRKRSHGK